MKLKCDFTGVVVDTTPALAKRLIESGFSEVKEATKPTPRSTAKPKGR